MRFDDLTIAFMALNDFIVSFSRHVILAREGERL
jgi:hypothetical protein